MTSNEFDKKHMTPIENRIRDVTSYFGNCSQSFYDHLFEVLSDYEYAPTSIRTELLHLIDQQCSHRVKIDFENYSFKYFIQVIEDEMCATNGAIEKETLRTHPELYPDCYIDPEEAEIAGTKAEILMVDTIFKSWSFSYHLKRFEGKDTLPSH